MTASLWQTVATHRGTALTVATFMAITGGAWFTVPGPRWALVTLGASGSLLLIAVATVAFPLSLRVQRGLAIGASVSHAIAFTVTLNVPPTMTVGDPPGRMLTSVSLQPMHAIRYRVPFPQSMTQTMRVRLVLARPYSGPANIQVDISGMTHGLMTPGESNTDERQFAFDRTPFGTASSALLTFTLDVPDPNLRIAVWKSGLGRTLPDAPEYITEEFSIPGLPDSLTSKSARVWPLIWVSSL
ncbi:MAG: hypothetical protein KGR25_02940 [Chloroflexi bacterium]|nr:hypothetical protein [Chloroflexota bacterium]